MSVIYDLLDKNNEIIILICNIFIAIGTVGAVIISLYFSFKSNKKKRELYIIAYISYDENNLNQVKMTVTIENVGNITTIISVVPKFIDTESNNKVPIIIPSSGIYNIEYNVKNMNLDKGKLEKKIIDVVIGYYLLDSFNNFYYPERVLVNGHVHKYQRPKLNLCRKILIIIRRKINSFKRILLTIKK